jgi:hypothetical protein
VRIADWKIMKVAAPRPCEVRGIDEPPRTIDELAAGSISGGPGRLFH